jgi:hypothetical protein
MFRHVSKSGQTQGNISKKHRETSKVSEFATKIFCSGGNLGGVENGEFSEILT